MALALSARSTVTALAFSVGHACQYLAFAVDVSADADAGEAVSEAFEDPDPDGNEADAGDTLAPPSMKAAAGKAKGTLAGRLLKRSPRPFRKKKGQGQGGPKAASRKKAKQGTVRVFKVYEANREAWPVAGANNLGGCIRPVRDLVLHKGTMRAACGFCLF